MFNPPLGYFITFRTYGSWLHGDERGSVDRKHNQFGTPALPPQPALHDFEKAQLQQEAVKFDPAQRLVIERTLHEVAAHKRWTIHAVNVRTNHVHVVVTASTTPELVMNAFKSWSTRRLREAGLADADDRLWSRHGSTIYLFRPENMAEKIRYVNDGQ